MVIGTASVIMVVTVCLSGKNYVLTQIESIGVNWVFAEYRGGIQGSVVPDPLTIRDFDAIMEQVPGIATGSPIMEVRDSVAMRDGHVGTVDVLGVLPGYVRIRNLVLTSGRFMDNADLQSHGKVAVITDSLALHLFPSEHSVAGHVVHLGGLPFTIIGSFKEKFDTFGRSEVAQYTALIPYSVCRFLTGSEQVKQLYFSMASAERVSSATAQMHAVLKARHRPESVYWVDNLTQLTAAANNIATALTVILLFIAGVTLLASAIGITNIMLTTVLDRTKEIGIRKALGATRRDICAQFLSEALFISLSGGVLGAVIGVAVPYLGRLVISYEAPVSGLSVLIGLAVSAVAGISAGLIPAIQAARISPIESLRYE
jgi:putative ABC transport system permease protein